MSRSSCLSLLATEDHSTCHHGQSVRKEKETLTSHEDSNPCSKHTHKAAAAVQQRPPPLPLWQPQFSLSMILRFAVWVGCPWYIQPKDGDTKTIRPSQNIYFSTPTPKGYAKQDFHWLLALRNLDTKFLCRDFFSKSSWSAFRKLD